MYRNNQLAHRTPREKPQRLPATVLPRPEDGRPRLAPVGATEPVSLLELRPMVARTPEASTPSADALLEYSRTVLRQFRRESGHYYWQVLVADDPLRLHSWREVFGDERCDYAEAMRAHYHAGPPATWQREYISPYAAAHPWEDFAETWAYYLHVLALVSRTDARRSLEPFRGSEALSLGPVAARDAGFRALLRRCLPAVLRARRQARRGKGRVERMPLAPPARVVRKLAWVHGLVQDSLAGMQLVPEPRLA